jgi:hypothetical protein
MHELTPRQRGEISLRGGHSDRVPFTIYENKIPQCVAEREMRNRGMCIVNRNVNVFRTRLPNVKITQHVYWEGDKEFTRTFYETPVGTVTTLDEAAGFTAWHHEKMFKSPEDYRPILFILQDERYEPNYEAFAKAEREFGGRAVNLPSAQLPGFERPANRGETLSPEYGRDCPVASRASLPERPTRSGQVAEHEFCVRFERRSGCRLLAIPMVQFTGVAAQVLNQRRAQPDVSE